MNYLIGGTPRSGKTSLKRLIFKRYKIPGICTDYLRDAFENEVPSFGIKDGMKDIEKSEILWPYFRGIIDQRIKYYEDNLFLEGTNFLPKYLKDYLENGKIKIVFLGYTEIDPEEKFQSIRNYPSSEGEWTSDMNDTELMEVVKEFIEISRYFKSECDKYGIRYFDTSRNYNQVVEEAATYLVGPNS